MLTTTLNNLAAFCAARRIRAWLVGGAARDIARGVAPADLDLAVEGDGLALAHMLADAWGGAFVRLDAERFTGRVVLPATQSDPPLTIDIAALRAPTIAEDLRLRDFTINAMAITLDEDGARSAPTGGPDGGADKSGARSAPTIDPCGGLADLRAGVLRACGPASLRDDPLRLLRAARLCAQLGLQPAAELAGQIRDALPGLDQVAAERIRDELLKLLDQPAATPWLRYLDDCGALTRILPALEPARACDQPRVHFLPVLAHMIETVAVIEWLIAGLAQEGAGQGGKGARGQGDSLERALPLSPPPLVPPSPCPPALPPAPPAAVQAYPDLPRTLPFAEKFAAHLAERRGGCSRAALLKLAALIHDNAKPQTKVSHPDGSVSFHGHQEQGAEVAWRIAQGLRMSRQDALYVRLVVHEHMRPGHLRGVEVLTARAVVRYFRDLGDAGPDVLLHELADHMATRGPQISPAGWAAHLDWIGELLRAYWSPPVARREPLVRGDDLMQELGLRPGPLLGELLREIAEAQAAGEISSREEALRLARERLG